MFNFIDRKVFTDVSWWHWAATIPLLGLHVSGSPWAIQAAMVLCAAALTYFLARDRSLRPYSVQTRIVYLGMLAAGTFPGMHWLQWVQLVGTTAMVIFGYCLLIRTLSLAPFNRDEPLSVGSIWHALFRAPCAGGLIVPSNGSVTANCSASLNCS